MLTDQIKPTQQEYEDIKLQLNVTPILQLVQDKSGNELLKLLHVEMREKKRMDHCRRIYQRLRFMMNRAYDKEYVDECRYRDIKIPNYIKQACGIKE
jgi:hypothetical protein